MGSTSKQAKKRAVTFRVISKQAGKRIFAPVNKRAKALTQAVDGAITVANLRGLAKNYRVLESPSLKKITL